jgi:hypothetical protein
MGNYRYYRIKNRKTGRVIARGQVVFMSTKGTTACVEEFRFPRGVQSKDCEIFFENKKHGKTVGQYRVRGVSRPVSRVREVDLA